MGNSGSDEFKRQDEARPPDPGLRSARVIKAGRGARPARADREHLERPYWTIDALAKHWVVSPRTVRRLIENGRLRAIRIGGQLRVSPEALERFEERGAA
jgi:excisionase family DNA binding protein